MPFDDKYMTSYMMTIVTYALSLTTYNIFAKQIKCQKFDLDNEGQGEEKQNLCRSTGNV